LIPPFVVLSLILSALAVWGFLQEVAYVFIFLAGYSLYRAWILRDQGRLSGWSPLLVFGFACTVALALAAPRLLAVATEIGQVVRSHTFNYFGYTELPRFFHEGIYGRYFEESHLLGNVMNLHEGLQLMSSTTLVIFVCLGALRPRSRAEAVGCSMLLALMLGFVLTLARFNDVVAAIGEELGLSPSLAMVALSFLLLLVFIPCDRYLRIGASLSKVVPSVPRPMDTSFHLFAVCIILALLLTLEGYSVVYQLFMKADFTHTRLSVLVLLPLCSLFPIYLAEMKTLPLWAACPPRPSSVLAASLIVIAALVAWLIHGPALELMVPRTAFQFRPYDNNIAMPTVVIEVPVTIIVLCALFLILTIVRRTIHAGPAGMIIIATFAIIESVTYAHLKVSGPQTWTYPTPFRFFNYFNVLPSVMRPPGDAKLAKFAEKLEVADYRSMIVSAPSAYPWARACPQLSQMMIAAR
jgi:hypothetical protein